MREREQMFTEFLGEVKKASNKMREEQKASTKSKAEKVIPRLLVCKYGSLVSPGEAGFSSLAEGTRGGSDYRGFTVEEGQGVV